MECQDLQHPPAADSAVGTGDGDRRVATDATAPNPGDTDDADIAGVVERAHLHLQRTRRIHLRRRYEVDDRPEQRGHAAVAHRGVGRRPALDRRGVEHRKIELLVRGAQPVEQIECLLDHPFRTRRRPVHLVDDDDRPQPARQRLAGDERRLRHRSFDRVDQQQHRIHHRQRPLDLAAEIGVSGRIDDVDPPVLPVDRRVLGENGDAALAFQLVGVHHPLQHLAVRAQASRLSQQLVDQRRLAMVDVRDDRDVADMIGGFGHGAPIGNMQTGGR